MKNTCEIEDELTKKFTIDELRGYAYFKDSFDALKGYTDKEKEYLKSRIFSNKPILNFDVNIKKEGKIEIAELKLSTLEKIEHYYFDILSKQVKDNKRKLNIKTLTFPLVIFFLTISVPLLAGVFALENNFLYSFSLAIVPLIFYFSFKKIVKNIYLEKFLVLADEKNALSLDEHISKILIKEDMK